jgi:hypothetical protein
MAKPIKPSEKQAMVDMFNSLPEDMTNKYEIVAKHFKRSTSACFRVIKESQQREPNVKYFDHTTFPF